MASLQETFAALVEDLDGAMLVITVSVDGERGGCLVEFSTPASSDPPRFIVCLSKKNRTFRLADRAAALAVHFLANDARELAELFGGETTDEVDKFDHCSWTEGPGGLPILDASPTWFAARIVKRLDGGDHEAFLLEPFEVRRSDGHEPFRASQARPIEPGHEL
ncbi:MAG: flavin reductase family protein [Thermoleophilaceae bacterium]